ncbi:hypothetical protein Rhopal_004577-T1 [Rhodotorula paludigena]|uniref:Arrestin-like N-terminal domain-containing protein n=1 Tax=Rhodotorula paludigena TaxID=86838 RepID=A0AAV5GM28_9BASI|nr:hypothetical protein Rhopal_004577-T1 [Rhodotorula paludigena]
MNDASPPGYSTEGGSAGAGASAVLVNLAPSQAEGTSFQLGFLGHGPAFVAGEVQVKYAAGDADARPHCTRLEVSFKGVERAHGATDPIDLFEQRQILWGEGAQGTSAAAAAGSAAAFPPSVTPFKLELTPDLPVCIHAPAASGLDYTLTATLFFSDPAAVPIVRCAPVHLVRTSPPGALLAGSTIASSSASPPSATPRTVSTTSPLAFSFRLPRTAFRRSEPIELMTRIEVPDAKAVGEGLRLRTVSAELVRTIMVAKLVEPSRPAPGADEIEELPPAPRDPAVTEPQELRTVLAHSGKSARFSSSRPIVIRLVLHPPTDPSCESITQSTILHTVSFAVVVTIGLVNVATPASASTTPPPEAQLSQQVFIVPDTPSIRSDKQKEVVRDSVPDALAGAPSGPWLQTDAPVPTYVENSEHDSGEPAASGSGWSLESPLALVAGGPDEVPYATSYPTDGYEEEYDGYEELSLPATLSTRLPPPGIYDDVSPPSAGEPSSAMGLELATAMGGVIDESDDGETPPPDDFAAYRSRLGAVAEAVESPPPPLHHSGVEGSEAETPPPHIDFPPLHAGSAHLPSTPPPGPDMHATAASGPGETPPPGIDYPHAASSPPPPAHLPPPYFGAPSPAPSSSAPALPPPPPPPASPPPPLLPDPREFAYPARASPAPSSRTASADRGRRSSYGPALQDELGARAYASRQTSRSGEGRVRGGVQDGDPHSAGERREGQGDEDEDEEDEGRPPPYEQGEEGGRIELVRFGVNRRGELVL